MLKRHVLLFNKDVGNESGSGGSGDSSGGAGASGQGTGNSGASGGGGFSSGQGAGNSGNGAGFFSPTSNTSGSNDKNKVQYPENWKLGLPPELQEDSALKVIQDIPSLAKSYISAQKLVGADKIVIPGKFATEEDWNNVYKKLGLPSDIKEYPINFNKDAGIPEDFFNTFKENAYKAGVLPQQAQKLADWFAEANVKAMDEFKATAQKQFDLDTGALKNEWGAAYEQKVLAAGNAAKHFGGEQFQNYLRESGLSNNVQLVKVFAKVAEVLKEDTINPGSGSSGNLHTPDAAKEKVNTILRDFNNPYYLKDHPNHKLAVNEVSTLMQQAYPNKK